jgi:hypothetical protein
MWESQSGPGSYRAARAISSLCRRKKGEMETMPAAAARLPSHDLQRNSRLTASGARTLAFKSRGPKAVEHAKGFLRGAAPG